MTRHLLSLNDFSADDIAELVSEARRFKANRGKAGVAQPLMNKTVALIFSKSSTRTRVSFEVAITELGGHSLFLGKHDLQLGRGESFSDTAQVLNRYVHAAVIRAHGQAELEEFARHADIPVINALTDRYHPCQLLADLQTIDEHMGRLEGVKVAYLGDGANNMANSWVLAAQKTGIQLRIGAPSGYQPEPGLINEGDDILVTANAEEAAAGADIVYTDVWVSMGFEDEADDRIDVFRPFQVNAKLMAAASPQAKAMHCLPAYRGKEITAEVLDGPQSIIWDEAENRLHAQKAVLSKLIC